MKDKKPTPLEALKQIERDLEVENIFDDRIEEIKIIETALEEKEQDQKLYDKISRANLEIGQNNCRLKELADKQLNDLIKLETVVEIIKKKGIDTETFYQFETYEDYQEFCENSETFRNLYGHYTQEDFGLLKEVLN